MACLRPVLVIWLACVLFPNDRRCSDIAEKYKIKYFYDIKDRSNFKANPDYKGVCHIALAQVLLVLWQTLCLRACPCSFEPVAVCSREEFVAGLLNPGSRIRVARCHRFLFSLSRNAAK